MKPCVADEAIGRIEARAAEDGEARERESLGAVCLAVDKLDSGERRRLVAGLEAVSELGYWSELL